MTGATITAQSFAQRMARAVEQAEQAGLDGVLITPGPDLVYFTGYHPTAITERITLLVAQRGHDPAMILPIGLHRRHGHLLHDPPTEFVERAAVEAPEVRVVVLEPGGSIEV